MRRRGRRRYRLKLWYIIFQLARSILPQAEITLAIVRLRGVSGKVVWHLRREYFVADNSSLRRQRRRKPDAPGKSGSKKWPRRPGPLSQCLDGVAERQQYGPEEDVKRRSGGRRRGGSSFRHRPATGGRSQRTGGRTGSWWARKRWRQFSTLDSL